MSGWLSNRLIAPADKVRPRSKRYDTSRSVTHCGLKVWSSVGLAALRFFHSPYRRWATVTLQPSYSQLALRVSLSSGVPSSISPWVLRPMIWLPGMPPTSSSPVIRVLLRA
ncbi:hypothetical protein D3C81_1892470 [compost metagenome]